MLTKEQLAHFQSILEDERSELQDRLKTLDRRLARNERHNEAEDLGDSASQVYRKEEVLFERNQMLDRLAEVDEALERIANGQYGFSEISGKPIPLARLEAMPTASTLVDEKPFT